MTPAAWLLVAAGVVVVLAVWVGWTRSRMARLERRVDRARTALETQLRRRSALAGEVAATCVGALGRERSQRLTRAASAARLPWTPDRELAENELGRELRNLVDDPPDLPAALVEDLAGTIHRVTLARRFYNDAVRDTRELRGRRTARLLRLHARRPLPRYFDIDDSPGGAGGTPDPTAS